MRATNLTLGLAGLLAAGLSGPAMAATTIWNFQTSNCTTNGSGDGNNRACTPAGAPSVTAYAFANTGTSNTILQDGIIQFFSGNGLGVKNRDRPGGPGDGGDDTEDSSSQGEHAIDNEDRKDSALLVFSEQVKLTDIEIGWKRSGFGSDMTVLGYTGGDGSACAGLAIAGQTYAALTSCGWNFVRHIADVPEDVSTSISNASLFSQYWLIGTHISDVTSAGTTSYQTIGSIGTSVDHAKLIAATGSTPNGQVPEPATLLLLATGALGLWRRRRVA